jgi:hypothetical protein
MLNKYSLNYYSLNIYSIIALRLRFVKRKIVKQKLYQTANRRLNGSAEKRQGKQQSPSSQANNPGSLIPRCFFHKYKGQS